jgi:hypothetical protein
LDLGSREAAIPAWFDVAERALEGRSRDRSAFYQIGLQRVKHKISRNLNAVGTNSGASPYSVSALSSPPVSLRLL